MAHPCLFLQIQNFLRDSWLLISFISLLKHLSWPWQETGIEAVNGLGMLLHQATGAFKLWTGKDMPTDAIWQELENIYNS